jgi:hypothetical protein
MINDKNIENKVVDIKPTVAPEDDLTGIEWALKCSQYQDTPEFKRFITPYEIRAKASAEKKWRAKQKARFKVIK